MVSCLLSSLCIIIVISWGNSCNDGSGHKPWQDVTRGRPDVPPDLPEMSPRVDAGGLECADQNTSMADRWSFFLHYALPTSCRENKASWIIKGWFCYSSCYVCVTLICGMNYPPAWLWIPLRARQAESRWLVMIRKFSPSENKSLDFILTQSTKKRLIKIQILSRTSFYHQKQFRWGHRLSLKISLRVLNCCVRSSLRCWSIKS